MDFADFFVQHRFDSNDFLTHIDQLIDWKPVQSLLYKHESRAYFHYEPLSLFKSLLIGYFRRLSDRSLEFHLKDSLSANRFCGFALSSNIPDHSTFARYRSFLSDNGLYDRLLEQINAQIEAKGLIVKRAVIIDASVIDQPARPRKAGGFEPAKDRKEEDRKPEDLEAEKQYQEWIKINEPGTDPEATYLKKGKEIHFGYKNHSLTDENGLVLAVATTAANVHDVHGVDALLEKLKLDKNTRFKGDKGYAGQKTKAKLRHCIDRRMHKAYKNNPLTERQKLANHLISKTRYVVERTFGGIKKWFGGDKARYKGLKRIHGQNVLMSIAYNLKRLPMVYLRQELSLMG